MDDLENNTLNEIIQMEEDKNRMISLMWDLKQKATHEQTKQTKAQIQTTERWVPEKRGLAGRVKRVQGVEYTVTGGD